LTGNDAQEITLVNLNLITYSKLRILVNWKFFLD